MFRINIGLLKKTIAMKENNKKYINVYKIVKFTITYYANTSIINKTLEISSRRRLTRFSINLLKAF